MYEQNSSKGSPKINTSESDARPHMTNDSIVTVALSKSHPRRNDALLIDNPPASDFLALGNTSTSDFSEVPKRCKQAAEHLR